MVNETDTPLDNIDDFSELFVMGCHVKMDHVKAFHLGLLQLALCK